MQEIAAAGVTSFSVELMPRITRAQSMDALSSMGTISGYKAVLIGADKLPRIFLGGGMGGELRRSRQQRGQQKQAGTNGKLHGFLSLFGRG